MTVWIVPRAIEESLTHHLPNLIAQVEKKLSNLIKIDSWSWVRILENTLAVDMSDAAIVDFYHFKKCKKSIGRQNLLVRSNEVESIHE